MSSQGELLNRSPAKCQATVMFFDIRGFSQLFDQHDPMDVLVFANTVLSELGKVVEACGGVIDKFTGDGFLAHFGVLEPTTTHIQDACGCAIQIREKAVELNLKRNHEKQLVVNIGIGINTGIVASGVITTTMKAEFSVFGDVVNMASRIESLTKEFMVDCLVSEAVYLSCREQFAFQAMPTRQIRGFKMSQTTYWLLPTNLPKR